MPPLHARPTLRRPRRSILFIGDGKHMIERDEPLIRLPSATTYGGGADSEST